MPELIERRFRLEGIDAETARSLPITLENLYPLAEFSLDEKNSELLVTCSEEGDRTEIMLSEIVPMISRFAKATAPFISRLKKNVIFSRTASRPASPSNQIHGKRQLPGVVWFGPEVASLIEGLLTLFSHFAERTAAQPLRPPILISERNLARCGYLPRNQHQVSKVSAFVEGVHDEHAPCLIPAACLSTYPALEGAALEPETAYFFSTKVFRRENGKFSGEGSLSRLWEFTVSEFIFFGGSDYLANTLTDFRTFIEEVSELCDLSVEICNATDNFIHPEHVNLSLHQQILQSKYEVRHTESNPALSLSSFNLHGSNFTREFSITSEAADFQSACIGFGIERWVYALCVQHDLDHAARLVGRANAAFGSPRAARCS